MQIGLKLSAKAGFNILKAPQVWDDMAHATSGLNAIAQNASMLATHPAHASRATVLRLEIESMQQRGWFPGRHDDGLWSAVETKRGYFAV